MPRTHSEPAMNKRSELKNRISCLVKESVKERSGPSFDERLQVATAAKMAEMRRTEKEQNRVLREARVKGEQRALAASVFGNGPLDITHANADAQHRMLMDRKQAMSSLARQYAKERKQMLERLRTREPLFRLSDVAAAKDDLLAKKEKRKRELQEDERQRWANLENIHASVLQRPLLMDLC